MGANQDIVGRHQDVGESRDLDYLEKNRMEEKGDNQNLGMGVDNLNQVKEVVIRNDEDKDQDKNHEENYGVEDDNVGDMNDKMEEGQDEKEGDYVNNKNGVDQEGGVDDAQDGDDGDNPDHNDDDDFSKEMAKLDFMEKNRNARALSKDPPDDAEIADNDGALLPPVDSYDNQDRNEEEPGELIFMLLRGRRVLCYYIVLRGSWSQHRLQCTPPQPKSTR